MLFTEQDLTAGRATHEVPLDPALNRTGDVWHILLPAVDTSLLYGYRVAGPHQDEEEQEEAVAAAAAAAAAGVAEGTMEGAESTYEEGGDASEADEPKLRLKVGHRHNEVSDNLIWWGFDCMMCQCGIKQLITFLSVSLHVALVH